MQSDFGEFTALSGKRIATYGRFFATPSRLFSRAEGVAYDTLDTQTDDLGLPHGHQLARIAHGLSSDCGSICRAFLLLDYFGRVCQIAIYRTRLV
jgi:hypothetical protein